MLQVPALNEGDDYEVISLRVEWAMLSIVCFLLTLPAKYLLQFVPWRPERIWLWPLIPPVVILGLSLVGVVTGWLGLRYSRSRGLAKAGVFLNGVVLVIVLLITGLWFYVVTGR